MKKFITIVLLFLVLSACAPSLPDDFKAQIRVVIQEGTTLAAMTKRGATYDEYGNQLLKVHSAYDLALAQWPDGFAPLGKVGMERSLNGWDLSLLLWEAKISRKDNPTEPNFNRYNDFVAYAGNKLVTAVWDEPSLPDYDKKKYLPYDENISILFSLANTHFDNTRGILLAAIK